jgi:hypothetical protein
MVRLSDKLSAGKLSVNKPRPTFTGQTPILRPMRWTTEGGRRSAPTGGRCFFCSENT